MKKLPTFNDFLNEESVSEKVKIEDYLGPEDLESLLGTLYRIISGNRRDYAFVEDVGNLEKFLKKYDKYSEK